MQQQEQSELDFTPMTLTQIAYHISHKTNGPAAPNVFNKLEHKQMLLGEVYVGATT